MCVKFRLFHPVPKKRRIHAAGLVTCLLISVWKRREFALSDLPKPCRELRFSGQVVLQNGQSVSSRKFGPKELNESDLERFASRKGNVGVSVIRPYGDRWGRS